MEDIGLGVPLILEKINELLDNDTLVNCMEVSFTFFAVIENQKSGRFLTTRKIQSYTKEFENDWMIVCQKLPLQKLEEFSSLVKEFYDAVPMRSEQRWSPMHIAAERGCLDFCQMIAKTTPLKYSQCQNEFTPIHFAAQAGHVEVYEFLTENVNDKNPTTDRRLSPLHLAAKNGNLLIYQSICKNALDINPTMDKNITPLHLAAQFGQLAVCKYICDNTGNVRPQRSFDGAFPLSLAISRGQIRIAKLLIQNDLYNIVHDFFMRIKTIFWLIGIEWSLLWLAFLQFFWLGFHKNAKFCDPQENVMATLIFDILQFFWFGDHKEIFVCDRQNNLYLIFGLPFMLSSRTFDFVIVLSIFLTIFLFVTAQIFFWIMLCIAGVLFSYSISPILDH